jgi:hypothetical protein
MSAIRMIILFILVAWLITAHHASAANQGTVTFPAQRVHSFMGTNVSILPDEDVSRQFAH